MKKTTSDIGMNRTGIATSPIDSADITQAALARQPSHLGDESLILKVRQQYALESEGVGSVPPPVSLKGVAKTAVDMLKGSKPTVFIDKLGERAAFERTGVRLYQGALGKLEALGSWEGGPTREGLERILNDELSHFGLVTEALTKLGADPTAVTPSADVVAVASMGIPAVVSDPRMNLRDTLSALLVAELTDNACWEMLIELARGVGHDTLADRFQLALDAEAQHLSMVRGWLSSGVTLEARAAPMPQAEATRPAPLV
ncbi:ferritin-like domain-containing protein [Myxococcus sp. RHSTA-1-4]|uniref:ferritin-like domain-containing protein n=1 Tax=Myxococcus sp. RHSTA-1-4 TaxID=2874601 RepID=UPI001CC16630|nr:ferritin-like domain-containing protein [Myxococcus sp. RHSTA-1-4]MBZ4423008.1 ferritin-like domain-containing protein [Myxococcus sp. RHSTA-1-4]